MMIFNVVTVRIKFVPALYEQKFIRVLISASERIARRGGGGLRHEV